MKYKHLFGPVPSRRLGMSLGVDLVPHKVCTFNCVYCEVGKTTNHTLERKEYVPIVEVLDELSHYLSQEPVLDFITFSGAGEPTLNSGIGEVAEFIKENYPKYKLALLTNSSLLGQEEVRNEVINVDLILPSLDAVSQDVFVKINQPQEGIFSEKIIESLIRFNQEFSGEMWLEVFIVPAVNDTKSELKLMKKAIKQIKPAKIQLNTLDRPGTENWVQPKTEKELKKILKFFKPLPVEIIAKFRTHGQFFSFNEDIENQIFETIRRRPCTSADLSEMLGLPESEINKYLKELLILKKIFTESRERGVFYRAL
ncbi:MAG: radical SAM protein [Candidatus Cloacimonetes bacterium]|nr:radical SAM protein [Candidatus Cloacimonadota bacterium]MCF7813877.1 radical SAM protein [Candidatus Cloacimonadota bacterium]MCF7868912.1 radical SAM protein [Candidatus Cloacimonadota bacterium]MCF7883989.1 radical SAM protein [Candidatus Cloacimonadota bacterium]